VAAPRPGLRWADLLRRVYDIDISTCPNCGQGRLEPIATILDPDANQFAEGTDTMPAKAA
jgi:hypothetical protein